MSYQTYTTDALVCGTYDRNTADRTFRLFTRELGMLYADARSVRLEKSKQRMALSDFSLVRVSLVRGKGGWKIGSVTAQRNVYHDATDQAARGSVVSLVRLVRRYVQGEEVDQSLFDQLVESLGVLIGPISERTYVEQALTVRLLVTLGYVSPRLLPTVIMTTALTEIADTYSIQNVDRLTRVQREAESTSHL